MKKILSILVLAVLFAVNTQALEMRGDTIYFLFLDRFSDGNPSNNTGNTPQTYSSDKSDWKKYWGGDIQGLINNLDYLEDMGISAIWITPLYDNVDKLNRNGDAAYHGYWGKDFFRVDEHLGTWQDIQNLENEMNKPGRNMKLILDFAPNHSNPNDENEFGVLYRNSVLQVAYYSNSTAWYHQYGGVTDWNNWFQVTNHNLFNLADFNQSYGPVYNYLSDAAKRWVDAGVDAIRIDAIKHMDISFIQTFTNDLVTYANSLGRDGFYFFGEWFGASAWAPSNSIDHKSIDYANTSGSALLDFGLRDTLERVMCNRPGYTMQTLNKYLEDRDTTFSSPDWQVTFVDNHDMARFSTALRSSESTFGSGNNEQGGGFSENFAKKRLELAVAVIMSVRGIPCIYYGTEQYATNFTENAFGQVGSDPYNREMMPSFSKSSDLYGIIKKLADLRESSEAIQKGDYKQKWVNDDILVYERRAVNNVSIVALNKGPAKTINVGNLSLADGSYTSLIGNDSVAISGGMGTFDLSQNEIIVLQGYADDGEGVEGVRTVVFIHSRTKPGDFIYIRGGHDTNLVPGSYPNRYEDIIKYNNMLNPDSIERKGKDSRLDWGPHDPANASDGWDSALDWTCKTWPSGWGSKKEYAVNGFGEDPENDRTNIRDSAVGADWWKFDARMKGSKGDWFEFKAYLTFGDDRAPQWESYIEQDGRPKTGNHWGKKGYITFVDFNNGWVKFKPLDN